jgi:hypothetical protein
MIINNKLLLIIFQTILLAQIYFYPSLIFSFSSFERDLMKLRSHHHETFFGWTYAKANLEKNLIYCMLKTRL